MLQLVEVNGKKINLNELLRLTDKIKTIKGTNGIYVHFDYVIEYMACSFEDFLNTINDLKSIKERGVTFVDGNDNYVIRKLFEIYSANEF